MSFLKNDQEKPRTDLLPPLALVSVARVLGHGAKKYSADNWAKTDSMRRYAGAALRHVLAWLAGEDLDPESGESHLAHAICCLLFMEELSMRGLAARIDDRWQAP